MTACPFCSKDNLMVFSQSKLSMAFKDTYPISPGHTLIIPKRHVESYFDLSMEEQIDLLNLLTVCQKSLNNEYHPSGYNIGINEGKAAGQTIMHVHMHLIPRYNGDKSDPRGGVRWIFPDKAIYWKKEG